MDPIGADLSVRMNKLNLTVGQYGEIVADRGNVRGTVKAAKERGLLAVGDDKQAFLIPWEDIRMFVAGTAPAPPEDRLIRNPPERANLLRHGEPIEKIKMLATGSQGEVWLARYQNAPKGELIVIKAMIFKASERSFFEKITALAKRITTLEHRHLIEYIDVQSWTKPELGMMVVMPYYAESDLLTYVAEREHPIPEFDVCSLVLQVAQALEYLHSRNPPIFHRDVKLENVLLFDNFKRVLLMDLDMSTTVSRESSLKTTTICGTLEYMAPEVQRRASCPRSDVWSLGVVLLVLLVLPVTLMLKHPKLGSLPLNNANWSPRELERAIRAEISNPSVKRASKLTYSGALVSLVVHMLKQDPTKRLDSYQLVHELEDLMVMLLTSP